MVVNWGFAWQTEIHSSNLLSSDSPERRRRVQIRSSSCSDPLLSIAGPNGTFLLLTPNNSREPHDNERKLTVANIDSDAASKNASGKGTDGD